MTKTSAILIVAETDDVRIRLFFLIVMFNENLKLLKTVDLKIVFGLKYSLQAFKCKPNDIA